MPSEPPRSEAGPASREEVELGRVAGVFGVRGEVRLHLHNPDSFLLNGPARVALVSPDGARREVTLRARPGAGKRIIGRIEGVGDRDAAASLMEWRILVPASELPPPEDDEFYVFEVEGLPVFVGEERRGTVVGVHHTPAGEVLEVDVGDGTVFVPAVERFVQDLDLEGGRVLLSEDALEEP